jgi:hypothetical protein
MIKCLRIRSSLNIVIFFLKKKTLHAQQISMYVIIDITEDENPHPFFFEVISASQRLAGGL